ncbi:glycosyltransferase [Paenibacillus contaminans]|uniref:Glycosyl transferase family 2 n=1 Tax=Paenibacillus contaminans TaxID=450362 RepID=A0A329MZF1_9BACL|nr:glycosyltransferase [Paenibacillus contaminans]RAV22927.1 glycosyl transferase family 2 [Paenibacillus contaminans]
MRPAGCKLTLSMIVRNESDRYLRRALEAHREYIDEAVIIDDGSTDDTAALCREMLDGIPLHLVRNPQSSFHNEVELRKQQWRETAARHPDWILNMDADEWFEKGAKAALDEIVQQNDYEAVYFRLYDMWSETHFREDDYWRAHQVYRPFLVKHRPELEMVWKETPQHCGRFPLTIHRQSYWCHPLRVKHFGWAKEKDRIAKYERYMRLDGEGRYGWKEQYESILDEWPNMIPWED